MIQKVSFFVAVLYGIIGNLISLSVQGLAKFRSHLMIPLSLMILCGFAGGCSSSGMSVSPIEFWVSPFGNDASLGTLFEPFLTLERARDAVRALNDIQRERDIVIYIKEGTIDLSGPLCSIGAILGATDIA
jgi:hypothetical protein